MTLSIAIQMDPPARLLIEADSSLELAREAVRRGFDVSWYEARTLALSDGRLTAALHPLTFAKDGRWLDPRAPATRGDLRDRDVVLVRQDPPFDMAYITATYLLEHLQPDVLVTNDPAALRNAPEKLLPTYFPHLTPPTLITGDIASIRQFRLQHGALILKPLYRAGGAGIVYVSPTDPNLEVMVDLLCSDGLPIVAQAFIPEVAEGDKRIFMVDGEATGCLLRTPVDGSVRSNVHAGGIATLAGLTDRDREICAAVGPVLRDMGLLLAGLDVIGPWLTEINVTSPGVLHEFRQLSGIDLAVPFWMRCARGSQPDQKLKAPMTLWK